MLLLSKIAVANGFQFSLTIRPIDIVGKTVPSDLQNTRFNDSLMVNRFKSLIDFIFTKVDVNNLLNLQIGSEIDGYNTSNEPVTFWADYEGFLDEINRYIKSQYPNLKVGFAATLKGLNSNPILFNQLLTKVDLIGVTYYPINTDFTVESNNTAIADLDTLLSNYPTKPIYLQELGFQTGSVSNSNELKQAQFYTEFLSFWDQHTAEINSVNVVRLNDLSLQEAQNSAIPYGINDSFL